LPTPFARICCHLFLLRVFRILYHPRFPPCFLHDCQQFVPNPVELLTELPLHFISFFFSLRYVVFWAHVVNQDFPPCPSIPTAKLLPFPQLIVSPFSSLLGDCSSITYFSCFFFFHRSEVSKACCRLITPKSSDVSVFSGSLFSPGFSFYLLPPYVPCAREASASQSHLNLPFWWFLFLLSRSSGPRFLFQPGGLSFFISLGVTVFLPGDIYPGFDSSGDDLFFFFFCTELPKA